MKKNSCKNYNRIKHQTIAVAKTYNNHMYERVLQKEIKRKKATKDNDIESPPRKRRTFVTPIISNHVTCCFYRETRIKKIKSNNEQNPEEWLKIYSLNKIIF